MTTIHSFGRKLTVVNWIELPGSDCDFGDGYCFSFPPSHGCSVTKTGLRLTPSLTESNYGPLVLFNFIDSVPDGDSLEWNRLHLRRLQQDAEIAVKEELKDKKKKKADLTHRKTWFLRLADGAIIEAQMTWGVPEGLRFAQFMIPQILGNIFKPDNSDQQVPDPVWNFDCKQTI
jgi:hypothetical protein